MEDVEFVEEPLLEGCCFKAVEGFGVEDGRGDLEFEGGCAIGVAEKRMETLYPSFVKNRSPVCHGFQSISRGTYFTFRLQG